ncbi:MAG: DegT/DnrJ/EryC1/StrS family aminotransferase [Deltaproteobacteria bacterium]|nr:DegT/DnrJ/EryC1/StrS family aminotransferase [Deltaproteobacteria bacterium]
MSILRRSILTANKDIVLDVSVIIDLWVRENSAEITESLIDESVATGVKLWVAAPALATLDYVAKKVLKRKGVSTDKVKPLVAALMNNLLSFVSVLTSYGFDRKEIYEAAHDFEDAQIAATARSLSGSEVCIVTEDGSFDNLGEISARTPAEALVWIRDASDNNAAEIPFVNLAAQQRAIFPRLEKGIHKVLTHGRYIMGPEVKELEEKLATDALLMALMAKSIGPGDAIFTTPFTFIATAEVISLLGATPVFVDIDPQTFNIDPDKLKLAIQALKANDASIHPLPKHAELSPKGIITVDLFGLPCDYDKINAVAEAEGLFVIEDGAQGLGGEYKGRKACSLGDIGCTSFFPAKPLGCYGDGGAVFTDDDEIAEIMASIRVHGKGGHKYDNARIGLNARLDTLQAAILIPKLAAFPKELEARRQVATRYTNLLSDSDNLKLTTPHIPSGLQSAWAQYSILAENSECRSNIQNTLKGAGIPTAIYYPKPLHLQTAYKYLGYKEGSFPISEDCSQRIFSLPMHPYLEDKQIELIAEKLFHTEPQRHRGE